ncbi:PhzF family phenazine biosynthesis protein [Roseivirga sp.]|uniref:PhzF family phenazine biosynthesis protein n=1 Tax=Roseivirga sp. TaxID=1964215 RepID=UPI003B517DA8
MKLYQIDSFTKKVFKGNPAGVALVEESLSEETMQALASEMNLAETAFVVRNNNKYGLRWFTPAREVPLCGHATLASAFVLFNEGLHDLSDPITFETLSGDLIVSYEKDGSLLMDFPRTNPVEYTRGNMDKIQQLFGDAIVEVLEVPNELIVILDSADSVRKCNPSSDVIASLAVNGVMVSGWDHSGAYDFVSRYFAPNLGIKEDPVTGFIHTILSPYWSSQKAKNTFKCYQASPRGGELLVTVQESRILIQGYAVKVFETEVNI